LRLKKEVWNKGLASEGALICLDYGFTRLGLTTIYAITPKINRRSERIMQKAGLRKEKNFHFVLLKDSPHLEECVLYSIHKPMK
jgi:ribosomal-protein-alanine N-acetyltransferase